MPALPKRSGRSHYQLDTLTCIEVAVEGVENPAGVVNDSVVLPADEACTKVLVADDAGFMLTLPATLATDGVELFMVTGTVNPPLTA